MDPREDDHCGDRPRLGIAAHEAQLVVPAIGGVAIREWDSFLATFKNGGELFHFCSHPKGWPERATDEGYIIVRDGVQVRAIFWVGWQSDCTPRK